MDRREELRREIDALLEELADEGGIGVARAPEPQEVLPPVVEEADAHGHGHAHMVTFSTWEDDEDGNLVEVDPGRFGRYDPEVDEKREPPVEETHGEGHAEGGHGGHEPEGAKPRKRSRRKAG